MPAGSAVCSGPRPAPRPGDLCNGGWFFFGAGKGSQGGREMTSEIVGRAWWGDPVPLAPPPPHRRGREEEKKLSPWDFVSLFCLRAFNLFSFTLVM